MPSCRPWPLWPYVICVAAVCASPESHDWKGCQGSALLQVNVASPEVNHDPSKSDVVTMISMESTKSSWFPISYPRISMAVAGIIVLVGCCSALRDVRADPGLRQDSRDGVWDVIKFALILCVFHYHITGRFWGGVHAFRPTWYAGFMMPCFVIISGLHSQSRVKLHRIFRDNVINNYMITFLLLLLQQYGLIGNADSYWFLWALAFYRICLGPLFSILMQYLGSIAGGIVCILIGLAISFTPFTYLPAVVSFEEQYLQLHSGVRCFITQNAVFFAVGFSIDPLVCRSMVSKPMLQIVAGFFMAMQFVSCLSLQSEIVRALQVLIHQEVLLQEVSMLIACRDVALRVLASFSFIACITCIYDAGFVPSCIQRCGTRTLYAYILQRPFTDLSGWSQFHIWMERQGSTHVVLSTFLQILLGIALSSPLCEWSFSWILSPQWVLDIFDGCKGMITERWKTPWLGVMVKRRLVGGRNGGGVFPRDNLFFSHSTESGSNSGINFLRSPKLWCGILFLDTLWLQIAAVCSS